MYEERQYQGQSNLSKSRRIEVGTAQQQTFQDNREPVAQRKGKIFKNGKYPTDSSKKFKNLSLPSIHFTKSYISIGKELPAKEKKEFCDFLLQRENPSIEFDQYKIDFELQDAPRNKKEYYTSITENIDSSNYWINWPTFATGDLPSMCAAILMGFKHGIHMHKGDPPVEPLKRVGMICAFLNAIEDEDNDNHYIVNKDGWKAEYNSQGTIIEGQKDSLKFSWLTNVVATGKYVIEKGEGIIVDGILRDKYDYKHKGEPGKDGNGKDLYEGFNEKGKNIIREAWLGKDYDSQSIKNWIEENLKIQIENLENKEIIILWIRTSGGKGGAHFENDTSFKALEKYIVKYGKGKAIFLAGDNKIKDGVKDATANKAQFLAEQYNQKEERQVYNITEFWKRDDVQSWGGDTRTGQFRLYEFLKNISKDNLTHIGSMSGGLEALALLGHKVDFKGREGDESVKRMRRYEVNENIHYRRIDFTGSNKEYDYAGYEKSSAKYYVFFSTFPLIKIIHNNTELSKKKIRNYFIEKLVNFNPHERYFQKGFNLSGLHAEVARELSREMAKKDMQEIKSKQKEERKRIKKEERERRERRKKQEKEYGDIMKYGNPNHTKGQANKKQYQKHNKIKK